MKATIKATISLHGEADTKLNRKRMALSICRHVLTNYGPLVYGLAMLVAYQLLTACLILIGALS